MEKVYPIKGIHPATGKVVEMSISAQTEMDAKQKAEDAGLEMVMVSREVATSHAPADQQGSAPT